MKSFLDAVLLVVMFGGLTYLMVDVSANFAVRDWLLESPLRMLILTAFSIYVVAKATK